MRVPGSPFADILDHRFSWYAKVREKKTGHEWTYWINGNHLDRDSVARFIAIHYPNVVAFEIQQTTKMPDKILQPVPREHYGVGALEIAERELRKMAQDPIARSLGIRPLRSNAPDLKTLSLR